MIRFDVLDSFVLIPRVSANAIHKDLVYLLRRETRAMDFEDTTFLLPLCLLFLPTDS